MDDSKKVVLLESALREILRIDEEAGRGDRPGSTPFCYALSGELRYSWLDIRGKVKALLNGQSR